MSSKYDGNTSACLIRYLKDPNAKLTYVGTTSFGQKRQLAVPMVVNEYDNGTFKTLFVGNVD